jgi:hypothetical protein
MDRKIITIADIQNIITMKRCRRTYVEDFLERVKEARLALPIGFYFAGAAAFATEYLCAFDVSRPLRQRVGSRHLCREGDQDGSGARCSDRRAPDTRRKPIGVEVDGLDVELRRE